MSQPPSQPPQPSGGFGSPQEPEQGQPGQPGQPGLSKAPDQPPQPPAQPPQAPGQPPAQPPQAPPAPSAPPAAPPAQPGYGYPQAPQPAADNPYAQAPQPGQPPQAPGQPQQPPQPPQPGGPYGQVPPPPGQQPQPGYGYPQQPQYPGAPMPGGPGFPGGPGPGSGSGGVGGFFKGKPAAIIGAAVAAALVIGAGVWFATSGGDDPKKPIAKESGDPKPGGSTGGSGPGGEAPGRDGGEDDLNSGRKAGEASVWAAKNEQDLPGNGAEMMDIWTVGDTVVQASYKEITAYGATDGKKKWATKLDGKICDTPPNPGADGKVVVAMETGTETRARCNQLQMVDLKTGKKGWSKKIGTSGAFDSTVTVDLEIAGDALLVARSLSGTAYRLSDGKELYKHDKDGTCFPDGYASDGTTAVGTASCAATTDKNAQLRAFDPKTGKIKWKQRTNKGVEVQKVYSVNPLVVSLVNRDEKSWSIVAFDDKGKVRSQLDGGKDSFMQRCGMTIVEKELQSCVGMVASDDTFYMATEEKRSGDYDRSNEVVAFDLDTGKPKWRGKTDEPRMLLPLAADSAGVTAYVEPSFDKPGQVVRFGPNGGKPKALLQNPESTVSEENSMAISGRIAFAGDRLFVSPGRLMGKDGDEETAMLSFGK